VENGAVTAMNAQECAERMEIHTTPLLMAKVTNSTASMFLLLFVRAMTTTRHSRL